MSGPTREPSDRGTVDEILKLVAAGHLSPEEADELLAALDGVRSQQTRSAAAAAAEPRSAAARAPRQARIEVTEEGRTVVNLRVPIMPLGIGRHALSRVPGLSEMDVEQITNAIDRGLTGRILEIQDEDGDGVRIVVE